MNWPAYFQAALEELDAFLANPRNAEWHDTMRAQVADAILMGIAQCAPYRPPHDMEWQAAMLAALRTKCKTKAQNAETEPCSSL